MVGEGGTNQEEALLPKEETLSDAIATPTRPATRPPEPHLDKARKWVVFTLLGIVSVTILLPFAVPCLTEKHWEFLHIIFPAEIGLVVSAIAFYFDRR